MLEISRIYLSSGLLLLISTVTFHLIAIGYPRWKVYEHRRSPGETIFIGIFQRCEYRLVNVLTDVNRFYSICDDNKYFPSGNNRTDLLSRYKIDEIPRLCNLPGNPHRCEYSSIGKSLISNTIIAASFLILSIFLIYSHLLINQFKYKTHLFIAVSTIVLLSLGLILILTSLIILGSTMSYDLFEYKFNFEFALAQKERLNQSRNFERTVRQSAATDFDIRLDWSAGLEIISLVLTSFTLVTQILYLFSTYRNRIG